jgi:hypothetical protein
MRSSKQRRWVAPIAAVVATAALALPAFASGATYSGTLKGGGTLSFKTVNRAGKIASVKSFSWKSVPSTCDQGAYSYSSTLPFGLAVKNKAFAITATGGGVVQQVTGVFHRQNRRATGILNVYGNLAAGHSNCSTGKLAWTATRG